MAVRHTKTPARARACSTATSKSTHEAAPSLGPWIKLSRSQTPDPLQIPREGTEFVGDVKDAMIEKLQLAGSCHPDQVALQLEGSDKQLESTQTLTDAGIREGTTLELELHPAALAAPPPPPPQGSVARQFMAALPYAKEVSIDGEGLDGCSLLVLQDAQGNPVDWPGLQSNKLFVRPVYREFFEREDMLDRMRPRPVYEAPHTLVRGIPGIGKSSFALYCLWRLWKEGRHVLYSYPVGLGGSTTVELGSGSNTDPIVIADGADAFAVGAGTKLLVTCPGRPYIAEFAERAIAFYMPQPTARELRLMAQTCFPPATDTAPDGTTLNDRIWRWGCVPTSTLRSSSIEQEALTRVVEGTTVASLRDLLLERTQLREGDFHLLHYSFPFDTEQNEHGWPLPAGASRRKYTAVKRRWASPYIEERVCKLLMQGQEQDNPQARDRLRLLRDIFRDRAVLQFSGFLWAKWAAVAMARGGLFRIRRLNPLSAVPEPPQGAASLSRNADAMLGVYSGADGEDAGYGLLRVPSATNVPFTSTADLSAQLLQLQTTAAAPNDRRRFVAAPTGSGVAASDNFEAQLQCLATSSAVASVQPDSSGWSPITGGVTALHKPGDPLIHLWLVPPAIFPEVVARPLEVASSRSASPVNQGQAADALASFVVQYALEVPGPDLEEAQSFTTQKWSPPQAAFSAASKARALPPDASRVRSLRSALTGVRWASTDAAASGKHDSKSQPWGSFTPAQVRGATAVAVIIAAAIFVWANEHSKSQHAVVAATVEQRLLDGIKARIMQPVRPPMVQPANEGIDGHDKAIAPLQRAAASDLFKQLERAYPISIVIAPEGCGKSTAARMFAADPANPHAIYVDLCDCSSFDAAAKRVAEAVGYRLVYSEDEKRCRQAGMGIDDLDKPWAPKEYDDVLRLFMRACGELKAAGKLQKGHPPMLILDHVSCPFADSDRTFTSLDAPPPPALVTSAGPSRRQYDTLIYQTLESTKVSDLAANRQCRFVFITSDPSAERDSWEKSGARDSLNFRVLPSFTTAEATDLLARHVYSKLSPNPHADAGAHQTAQEVMQIKAAYASTFAFIIAALGTCPHTLALCIDNLPGPFVPDTELPARGVPIPAKLLPFLPSTLPATVAAALAKSATPTATGDMLRVDAQALFQVDAWVKWHRKVVENLLFLDPHVVLAPSTAPPPTEHGQRMVHRVIDVDAALRALLAVGSMSEVDFTLALGCSHHLAPVLAEKHLVFYNMEKRTVQFASDAVKHVVIGVLGSASHKARLELASSLLECQEVSVRAEALAQHPRSIWGWLGDAAGFNASRAAAARSRAEQLETKIKQLRPLVARP